MVSDESVKDFVRNTLGCGCDEEVFKHIVNVRDVEAGGVTLRNRINVGNRLLVYVAEADTAAILEKLPALVKAGKDERDTRRFNRFRLVLVADDKTVKKAAFEAFAALGRMDEKIHLHVLGKNDVKDL